MISPEEERELNEYWEKVNKPTPKSTTSMTEAQQRAYDQAQVMLAFSQGKKIEFRTPKAKDRFSAWAPTKADPNWIWDQYEYRIAPEPQEVWLWVKGVEVFPLVASDDHRDAFLRQEQGYTKKLFREVC